jgi:hypothetical protein
MDFSDYSKFARRGGWMAESWMAELFFNSV